MAQALARILIVDDEPALCNMMAKLLSHWGYAVESACSPGEALAIFRSKPCDLVLVDLLLPGMTGQEVAPHIKSHSPNTPVVLISAFPPENVPGVDYIYSKPLSPAKLRSIVQGVLETKQSAQAA